MPIPIRLGAALKGASLIEALLATVLLSIALLGAASVQTSAMRQASAVSLQTQADLLARQMLDRMRLNPAGISSGSYNEVVAESVPNDSGCSASTCATAAAIAQADISQWQAQVDKLPGGAGFVSGSGPGSLYAVTVSWKENPNRGDAQPSQSLTLRSTLP